ncbi:MAG: Ger(x)C family spore germination protein [Clostridiales bacterium]|nr:Ger(x)C family spore germination protein [Clostridiales bacterium]
MMFKKILLVFLNLSLILSLCGCWNYQGLDELNIVVGIAVDFDNNGNCFDVSYESADLATADKKSVITGKITHSKGKNLFDAARNAKRREEDRLFFGGSQILIINETLAADEGILTIIEWFLRDVECRETISVAISQEDTAASILEVKGEPKGIVSITLHDIIKKDRDVSGTSMDKPMFQIYNDLHSLRKSTVMPALHKVKNGEGEVIEINGLAVIKEDRLEGYLSPEQSRYVLMIEDKLGGGIFTLSTQGISSHDISLEIFESDTKKSFSYESGRLTVEINTKTKVYIAENRGYLDIMDKEVVSQIETLASEMIKDNIENLVALTQQQYKTDLFGFGEMIHKRDLKLWNELSPMWDKLYPDLEIKVSAEVNAVNSASTR